MSEKTNGQINSLEKYYIYALKGSVKEIINELDTIPDNSLNAEELKLKEKYLNRFKNNNDIIVLNTDNRIIKDIYDIYRQYWYNVLMQSISPEQSEKNLREELTKYLGKPRDTTDIFNHSREILNKNDMFTANGKTAGIYDLLVWAKEDIVNYVTGLPEGEQTVQVVFMDSIISMGWEEYATFGIYYPGGWATKNALYCVKSAYDTSSEKFKISYLKHEGQHFADYKLYSKLSGADLEYRAKLVELMYANETLYKLISFFIKNTGLDRNNPHSFACYHMIKNLSKELFKQDTIVIDINEWNKLSNTDINKAAEKLFRQNSEELRKIGSEVIDFIK